MQFWMQNFEFFIWVIFVAILVVILGKLENSGFMDNFLKIDTPQLKSCYLLDRNYFSHPTLQIDDELAIL